MRTVAVLGSTGSVGTQGLEVIAAHPERFRVGALGAGGANLVRLAQQTLLFQPGVVAVAGHGVDFLEILAGQAARAGLAVPKVEVIEGPGAVEEIAGGGWDTVLNAVTGSRGLRPTLAAVRSGATVALANKESLVAAGPLVMAALQRPGQLQPVDSEHSALAQAARAGQTQEIRRLLLTASGGPFRGYSRAQLEGVTLEQALAHPTWAMGPVVTINSATLVNKGLELIEASYLFGVPPQRIGVVVHPTSSVHSMVEFVDGSTLAQVSVPDMRLPLAYALAEGERLDPVIDSFDWTQRHTWTFEPVDDAVFVAVELARQALESSATHPTVFNAANEEAVEAFRGGALTFAQIVPLVERVLEAHPGIAAAELTLAAVDEVEEWARARARELIRERG